MTTIDKNITIAHEGTKAHFSSDGKSVSDLYLWKQYRALVLELERLQAGRGDPADFDEIEQESFLLGTRML